MTFQLSGIRYTAVGKNLYDVREMSMPRLSRTPTLFSILNSD